MASGSDSQVRSNPYNNQSWMNQYDTVSQKRKQPLPPDFVPWGTFGPKPTSSKSQKLDKPRPSGFVPWGIFKNRKNDKSTQTVSTEIDRDVSKSEADKIILHLIECNSVCCTYRNSSDPVTAKDNFKDHNVPKVSKTCASNTSQNMETGNTSTGDTSIIKNKSKTRKTEYNIKVCRIKSDVGETYDDDVDMNVLERTTFWATAKCLEYSFNVLIDTGSDATIISKKIFRSLPKHERPRVRPTRHELSAANKGPIKVYGTCLMSWDFGPETLTGTVMIADISAPAILGMNMMTPYQCRIDCGASIMSINDHDIPLRSTRLTSKSDVVVQTTTELEAMTKYVIRCLVINPDTDNVLIQSQYGDDRPLVVVGSSLDKPHNSTVNVVIKNLNKTSVTLERGLVIGVSEPVLSIAPMDVHDINLLYKPTSKEREMSKDYSKPMNFTPLFVELSENIVTDCIDCRQITSYDPQELVEYYYVPEKDDDSRDQTLANKWLGPFMVLYQQSHCSYRIVQMGSMRQKVVHVDNLRECKQDYSEICSKAIVIHLPGADSPYTDSVKSEIKAHESEDEYIQSDSQVIDMKEDIFDNMSVNDYMDKYHPIPKEDDRYRCNTVEEHQGITQAIDLTDDNMSIHDYMNKHHPLPNEDDHYRCNTIEEHQGITQAIDLSDDNMSIHDYMKKYHPLPNEDDHYQCNTQEMDVKEHISSAKVNSNSSLSEQDDMQVIPEQEDINYKMSLKRSREQDISDRQGNTMSKLKKTDCDRAYSICSKTVSFDVR